MWKNVNDIKHRILNGDIKPDDIKSIPDAVVKSWLKAKSANVPPSQHPPGVHIDSVIFEEISFQKSVLINAAKPYFKKFQSMFGMTNTIMVLTDETGLLLMVAYGTGMMRRVEMHNVMPGAMWSSETVGTTAHELSMANGKPFLIIGPYNYCYQLKNNISSSAPIYSGFGDVCGSIVVASTTDTDNVDAAVKSALLDMSIAAAQGISLSIRSTLLRSNRDLIGSALESIMTDPSNCVITVKRNGDISNINAGFADILGIDDTKSAHIKIASLLSDYDRLENLFYSDKIVENYRTAVMANGSFYQCTVDMSPIIAGPDDSVWGAVVKIKRLKETQVTTKQATPRSKGFTFGDIIGESSAIRELKSKTEVIAVSDVSVLLLGESGTGKEMFAQAIHSANKRRGDFIAVNCAAMPKSLIEAELFGYEGGAFTGAEKKGRAGKIELANNGTLFLDEIGDMPLELQPVLLRVLEEKKVYRLGSGKPVSVDFRLVAATNCDLYEMVKQHTFRSDLYFRLAVISLKIPPLNARGNDILLLANMFISRACISFGKPLLKLSSAVEKLLLSYPWPGNVRQLESAMIYAVCMSQGNHEIGAELMPDIIEGFSTETESDVNEGGHGTLLLEDVEWGMIDKALADANYNVAIAAKSLGIGRSTLYRKLKIKRI